jgi:CDP-4-dehydro-6-deoxyglucose reductase
MFSIETSSGKRFPAEKGASLLDAAAAAGISLPYSCKTGRCSACKCRVLSGRTEALAAESGLAEEEKAAGWILSCVRAAASDLLLETADLGAIVLPAVRTWPCRIQRLARPAADVLQVWLRLPPTAEFAHIPGQYIEVIGAGGLRRSYSLANASAADKLLELHIRQVEGGAMSSYWFGGAAENDLLRLSGPKGTFFLRDIAGLDLVFLATGTGIAPVKAMLEALPALSPLEAPRSVTVYWGGRWEKDLYIDLGAIRGTFRFVPVLSRAGAEWAGAKGYVQQALLEARPALENTAVYACGSDAMIHSAREDLRRAGLPEQRFFSDAFVCSAPN